MELNKKQLKETKPLIESNQLSFNEKDRTITHYVTTEAVNRYGYKLKNQGMNITNYQKNPIVLYNHTLSGFCDNPPPSELVIGKNLGFELDTIGQVATTKFADTPRGEEVMQMNKEGLMKSWSVGWNSDNDFEKDENGIEIMNDWELLEYSSVIIPANPEAVNKMLSFALTPSLKRTLGIDLAILNYKLDFESQLSDLKNKLETPKENLSGKEITDFKNEMKSLINNHKKQTTELFMGVAGKLNNLETNLHKEILSKMGNIVELTIRKYMGKVD